MTIFLKDAGAVLDYAVDWEAGYLVGQSIIASQWQVSPDEPGGIVASQPRIAGGQTLVTLAAGRPGQVYRITNVATFSDGSRDERMLTVRVEDR